jgi:hypothetical protein
VGFDKECLAGYGQSSCGKGRMTRWVNSTSPYQVIDKLAVKFRGFNPIEKTTNEAVDGVKSNKRHRILVNKTVS